MSSLIRKGLGCFCTLGSPQQKVFLKAMTLDEVIGWVEMASRRVPRAQVWEGKGTSRGHQNRKEKQESSVSWKPSEEGSGTEEWPLWQIQQWIRKWGLRIDRPVGYTVDIGVLGVSEAETCLKWIERENRKRKIMWATFLDNSFRRFCYKGMRH